MTSDEEDFESLSKGLKGNSNTTEAWIALLDTFAKSAIEAVVGYRNICKDAGFSPESCDKMAAEFHGFVLKLMSSKKGE